MAKFLIVLFKDKKRKKIINKFSTLQRADNFYKNYLQSNESVIFHKVILGAKEIDLEVGMVEMGKSPEERTYLKDEFGRSLQVKIDDPNMTLLKIHPIKVEEKFVDYQCKKRIDTPSFIKKYLSGTGIKLVSGLNNRVVVQKEEEIYLFTFKKENEVTRFLDCLTSHFIKIKKKDCILVKDSSKAQKKYLYKLLEEKGFPKNFLYRKFTSLPQ